MRLLLKITGTLILVFLIAVASLGLFAWLRQDQIIYSVVERVNKTINTQISYGDIELSIFESFPNIALRISNLLVEPSDDFDRMQFQDYSHDTLLFASSVSVTAYLPSVLTGTVAVRSITARDGSLCLLTDSTGKMNFRAVSSQPPEGGKKIRLNSINATNIRTVWDDRDAGLKISGVVLDSRLSGEIFGSGIFLNASLSSNLSSLSAYGLNVTQIPAEASVRLRKTENSVSISRAFLSLAGLDFGIDGMINFSHNTLDLAITGNNINISELADRVPQKWKSITEGMNPEGEVNLVCTVTGHYGEAGTPHFELKYDLSGGRLNDPSTALDIDKLSFRGKMTNGKSNSPETFIFTVDTLSSKLGTAYLTGSFMMENLSQPYIRLSVSGDLIFEEIARIIKSDIISRQEGSVRGSIKLSGVLADSMKFSLSSLPSLNPTANLIFSDFGATLPGKKDISFSNVNGAITVSEHLRTDSLKFQYRGCNFMASTEMRNFVSWVAGRPVILTVTGNLSADVFNTALLSANGRDSIESNGEERRLFPPDITVTCSLTADSVISREFRMSGFRSVFSYRPYVMNFENVTANGLSGKLSGSLMIGKQKDGKYISRAKLDVAGLDIHDTFKSFNNFGQSFIVSDNLSGRLTGSTTILTPLSGDFRIVPNALVAEAHLSISDGYLINFGPAESLSAFIDLDELKEIRFSRLENDVYIRASNVNIPKMLINSSAGNFTVYGMHKFNNDYEYHIRVLLSEMLSRKARDRNRNDSEFGKVQIDGTGKATVPVKIVCAEGVTSVSYDFGQAQNNIKENIAEEKQTMKGILNEEYGWYKGDTIVKIPQESKPKFRITWEESKEQTSEPEAEEEVTESPFRLILKKKK